MGTIIVSGNPFPCAAEVIGWHDSGLSFPVPKRRAHTDLVVEHWTGGENDAPGVHHTLRSRNLSVQFFVNAFGVVYQFCDATALCAQARGVNDRSVGIEIQNRADREPIVRGIKRELVVEEIHGVRATRTTFLPAQITAVLHLTEALCAAYHLPFEVPMVGNDVVSTALSPTALESFRGVIGHYHVTREKVDPGLVLMRAIAASHLRGRDGAAE